MIVLKKLVATEIMYVRNFIVIP